MLSPGQHVTPSPGAAVTWGASFPCRLAVPVSICLCERCAVGALRIASLFLGQTCQPGE